MPILPLIAWPLFLCSCLGLAFWLVIAYRVHRSLRGNPSIRAGLDLPLPTPNHPDTSPGRRRTPPPLASSPTASPPPQPSRSPRTPAAPKVSIIVPVHNEQHVIDACASSLTNQDYHPLEIIFVLDRCTDDTASILRSHAAQDPRITLIENDSCPDDWAGKCHAAHLGAQRASGDYLLFTDADTVFHPDLLAAAVALAAHRDIALLSLLSTLRALHAFERIAQPVASLNLVRMYPLERVNRTRNPRPFANGQFLLFTRDAYRRVGGHAAVKNHLLEDIAFARRIHDHHRRCGLFLADGMLTCSMYHSFTDFKLGWKRIYIEACNRKPRRLRKNALRVLANGLLLPLLQLAALLLGCGLLFSADPPLGLAMIAAVVAASIIQFLTLRRVYILAGAPPAAALLYPLGCWIVARIMATAADDLARHRPIPWAGKTYLLQPRE